MSDTSIKDRFKSAWNAFFNKDPTITHTYTGYGNSIRPDRIRFSGGNEKSIITAIYNRIAVDCAAIDIRHAQLDYNDRYVETIHSTLNDIFSLEANLDQTGRAFVQDIVASMLDEGHVAIVPVDTDVNPITNTSFKIYTMRTGRVVEWKPKHVKIRLYNDITGEKDEVWMPKRAVAIIENPFYAVMNEPNSILQRLKRKLNLLDIVDEQASSGKLDLIIQLPYIVKSEARKQQANQRRQEIVDQLAGSKYGIAYTDGTEKITQLNRPVENNLMNQIEFLTSMLYSQLGITKEVLEGSADEKTMLNYNNKTIEPIMSAIVDEFKRKFLTRTARSQGQSIEFFKDPFKLVPVSQVAEIADKMTRNCIMTSNEIRQIVGMVPSDDPTADELRNKNLNEAANPGAMAQEGVPPEEGGEGYDDYGPQEQ